MIEEDYKDLWFPDGPAGLFERMVWAFEEAGYKIRFSELSPHQPPVAVLRLLRKTAPQFFSNATLMEHVQEILRSVELCLKKRDLNVVQEGKRLLVSFLWCPTVTRNIETETPNDKDRLE